MIRRSIFFLLLLFVCISSVYASDSCFVDENCTWYSYGASGDGVNISFTYENGTTTQEYAMSLIDSGKYLYTSTFNDSGNVMGCARSYNASGTINTNCESKLILEKTALTSIGTGNMSLAPIILILSVAVISALLLFLAFKLDESHIFWKLFILGMVFIMIIFIPSAAIEGSKDCSRLPVNSTVSGGTTTYNYDLVCSDTASSTAVGLYKTVTWVIRITAFYAMMYVFLYAIGGLANIPKLMERMYNKRKRK